MTPIGYAFSGGYALCADCCTSTVDTDNETGTAHPVYEWDESAKELTCDQCKQPLQETDSYTEEEVEGLNEEDIWYPQINVDGLVAVLMQEKPQEKPHQIARLRNLLPVLIGIVSTATMETIIQTVATSDIELKEVSLDWLTKTFPELHSFDRHVFLAMRDTVLR